MSDNPVMFPPGRDKLATTPVVTGSLLAANTIGMLIVARLAARLKRASATRYSPFTIY
jgi:hypothetical protein